MELLIALQSNPVGRREVEIEWMTADIPEGSTGLVPVSILFDTDFVEQLSTWSEKHGLGDWRIEAHGVTVPNETPVGLIEELNRMVRDRVLHKHSLTPPD